jgi:hypothetical protein
LNFVFDKVHLVRDQARISWKKTNQNIVNVWDIRWTEGTDLNRAQITVVKMPEEDALAFKELVFIYPDYIVGLRDNFEYNYNHFAYIFEAAKLSDSQKANKEKDQILTFNVLTRSGIVQEMTLSFQITESTQFKTYTLEDVYNQQINAVSGTTIEFQVPHLNFRGNNLDYKTNLDNKGLLVFKNPFTITKDPKDTTTTTIEILDELYGQSFSADGKIQTFHICDTIITTDVKVSCSVPVASTKPATFTTKLVPKSQVSSLFGIYTAFEDSSSVDKYKVSFYAKKPIGDKVDEVTFLDVDFGVFGGDQKTSRPIISMSIKDQKVILIGLRGSEIVQIEIGVGLVAEKKSVDFKDYIPSFKGKNCTPVDISRADFQDSTSENVLILVNRSYITYDCKNQDGSNSVRSIVDWRAKQDEG